MFMASSILFQGSYFPVQYLFQFLLLALFILISIMRGRGTCEINKPILVMSTTMGLIYMLSAFFAADKYKSMLETLKFFTFVISFIAIAYQKDRLVALKGVFWGCLLVSTAGVLSYMDMFGFPNAVLSDGKNIRLQSVIQYANVTALFMGIGFLLSMYFFVQHDNFKSRIKYYLYAHMFLISLILTLSRGSIIVFFPVLVLWLVLIKKLKIVLHVIVNTAVAFVAAYFMNNYAGRQDFGTVTLTFIGAIVLIGAAFYVIEKLYDTSKKLWWLTTGAISLLVIPFVVINSDNLNRLLRISVFDGTFAERLVYAYDAFTAVKGSIFLGIGPGNWDTQQFSYQTAQYYARYIHNGILQFALDAGIAAAILFVGILAVTFAITIKRLSKSRDALYVTSTAIAVFIVIHSLIDVGLSFASVLMVLAATISIFAQSRETGAAKLPTGAKRCLAAAAVIVCLVLPVFYIIGDIFYNNASEQYNRGDYLESIRSYNMSKFFRPYDGEVYFMLAKCYEKQNASAARITAYLSKAHELDRFNPRVTRENIKYAIEADKYELAYELSISLLAIEPLNGENYEAAVNVLFTMLDKKLISIEDFKRRGEDIAYHGKAANYKINPLAKHLRGQSPVFDDEIFIKNKSRVNQAAKES